MKTKFFCLLMAALSIHFASAAPDPVSAPEALKWDADAKENGVNAGAASTAFTFVVTNVSKSDVVINKLQASCGCTAANLPSMPYTLGAGSNVTINVEMQLAGKFGLITKTVTVDSSAGLKTLMVSANIPTDTKTTDTKTTETK
jgi:hypothetical protein